MNTRELKARAVSGSAIIGTLLGSLPTPIFAQASPFMTGATALQSNILLLRCATSENGGTSAFASRLIGEREIRRRQMARGRDHAGPFGFHNPRFSTNISDQIFVETAVLASEIEQLADLRGYLKVASSALWREVRLRPNPCNILR